MDFRCRQNKNNIGRGLLQRFEQRVERADGEHVHLVDNVYAVAPVGGRILDLVADIPDILHAVVGGGVNLHHVHGGAGDDGPAGRTFVAGASVHRVLTVDCPGEDLRDTGFTGSTGSAEQVGVADASRRDLIFQGLYDGVLSLYVLK